MLQTEYEFTLPMGFVDKDGSLHTGGVMRLATAADEILPQRDDRVRSNPAYLTVVVLTRVITRIGELSNISTATIENLFAADLEHLQRLYNTINQISVDGVEVSCDRCAEIAQMELVPSGGSPAIPSIG